MLLRGGHKAQSGYALKDKPCWMSLPLATHLSKKIKIKVELAPCAIMKMGFDEPLVAA